MKTKKRYGNNVKYFDEDKWEQVNEENKSILNRFLRGKAGLSPKTLVQYKNSLQIFFLFVYDFCDNRPMYELDSLDFLDYQGWMLEEGLTAGSIRTKRAGVSSLCNFVEVYIVPRNPKYAQFRHIVRGVDNIQGEPKHRKEPLTEKEIKKLRKTLIEMERWQQLAYLDFTYSSGCRRAESHQLTKDVVGNKPNKNGVYETGFIRTKGAGIGGNVRKLKFSKEAKESMERWLLERGDDDCEFMFVAEDKDGKITQINETSFNYWCSTLFSDVIGRRVHPHILRTSRATNANSSGVEVEQIQNLLGHKSQEVTISHYIIKPESGEADDCF